MTCRYPLSCVAIVVALAAMSIPKSYGIDVFWNGGAGDLQWSNELNWSTGTLPGPSDRAVLHGPLVSSGYPSNGTIHLGANRTISEFRLVSNAPPFILTGDGTYSLTLTNGAYSGDNSGNVGSQAFVLDCDVSLGTNAVWQGFGQYGSHQDVNGTLFDGGNGYPFTFNGNQNNNVVFNGPVTLSSTVTMNSLSFTLGGPSGAMTNVNFYLMPSPTFNNADAVLVFNNNAYTNGDRFGDSHVIHNFTMGDITMRGHGTNAVSETIGTVAIDSGILTLENDYWGASEEVVVKSLTRSPGTALLACYINRAGTQSPGTNTKIRIQGESVNTNGIWHPWAIQRFYDGFLRVDTNGCLIPLATNEYATLPASGSVPTAVHRVTVSNFTVTASEEVYGLRMEFPGYQVLDLGTNDLTIGCGTLLFAAAGSKTLTSSGGRLVFGTNEIFIAGQLGGSTAGSNIVIHAPLASTATGAVYLCIADMQTVNILTIDGADAIGTYAGLTAAMRTYQSLLKLGGPSDRTINGPLCGGFSLVQVGTGTLRLNGVDLRFNSTIDVQTGRVVIGNSLALSGNPTVRNGARLDVASNIVWSLSFTAETNSTLGGDGTFGRSNPTLPGGLHLSPGNGVGKMSMSNINVQANTVIEWDLGSGTNTAGVDYDLLHVGGSLTLPNAAMQLTVRDASAGQTTVRASTTFTVADWTGTNPTNTPTWTVSNASPTRLDTSAATVQVSTATKKILLTGLRSLSRHGSIITFR